MAIEMRVTDITEDFVEILVEDLKMYYKEHINSLNLFNEGLDRLPRQVKRASITGKGYEEYQFEMAYNLYVMYHFIKNDIGVRDFDVDLRVMAIQDFFKDNPLFKPFKYSVDTKSWEGSRLGFMCKITNLKLRLLEGDDFNATELGMLMGITGQAIINRIKRDNPMQGTKRDREYVISNEEARRAIRESNKTPIL